ncbi:hypothetical protein Tco_0451339 [Tanacetum coccineum]
MADVNVNALAEQAPAMAPPTRTDDQILPRSSWVPIGKINCYFDVEKSQSNPIYKIVVDILKHTNFFRAFTASSTIPSIYIQQDALQITHVDNNNPFSSPLTHDALINFVNELGYPKVVKTLFVFVNNDMLQPWRALTTIINLCLTGKTSALERPRAPVGVVNQAHIDYAERIWEEFTQSIHSFVEHKKNLTLHTQRKKKANPLVIPSVRFTKLIIHHLQSKHKFHPRPDSLLHFSYEEYVLGYLKFSAKGTKQEVFGMPIPNELITADIRGGQYYKEYLEKVAKHQRYLASEEVTSVTKPAAAEAPKPTASQPPKPTPATTKPSKKDQSKKRKLLIDEFVDEGVTNKEPVYGDEEADTQRAIKESLKEVHDVHRGPLPLVVIREPDSGKFQPLPDIPKKKSHVEQYIFQRRSFAPTEPSGHDESSSLYAELGQAGPNPGIQDESQARSNPGDAAVSQPQSSHAVHAGPNHEHMDFKENLKLPTEDQVRLEEPASFAGTLSYLQNLDKELSFADQFLVETSQEDEPEKTNTESEVQSMVTVPIHQDTSFVPLMTTLVIDLTVSQPVSTTVQAPLPTSTATVTAITTTTSLLPPPTQPQQGSSKSILIQCICELEQHMADLVQDNLALEERLDKHGSRLYKLENFDIPHQVSKAVDEIVTDVVDWAFQAPLRDHFRDLLKADMKEILHHRIWETKSYEAHEDHKKLYEALEKLMDCDHSKQLLTDLAEARRKNKMRHESLKTSPGSPPHQPLPPPPPAGPSGTSRASRTSRSSQLHPPPPPLSTNQSDQSKSTATPSSSKTATLAEYTA